jgi:TetR/AcrR family transcriptional regulator
MSAGASRHRRPRSRGRPPVGAKEDVRAALLAAGRSLFLKHGFDHVSARQIAAAAGTTPAMIHYYFDNKLGLFRAMLEEAIGPFRAVLRDALAAEGDPRADLIALMEGHMRTAAANPWIATLLINEVFGGKGRLRATFIRDVASHLLPMVVELLERGRRTGRFRPDLDPRLAALSILSMCVFPFVSRAVTGPVLDIKLEGEALERLIAHTIRTCLQGIETTSTETRS